MRAMILAAGLGTRLRPLTNSRPKPLLPVDGTPLLVWNLLLLRKHGIEDVLINLHHLGDLIEKELGEGAAFGLRIAYSREPVLLGTGGGIKQAEWFFQNEPFLVLNGDTLIDVDLGDLIKTHHAGRARATMVVREDADAQQWGGLDLDERQRVVRIGGRGLPPTGPTATRMFAGVHVMHPLMLRDVPPGRASSIIDAYVGEIVRGEVVLGYTMNGYWSDVGTPARYARVQQDVDRGLIRLADRL